MRFVRWLFFGAILVAILSGCEAESERARLERRLADRSRFVERLTDDDAAYLMGVARAALRAALRDEPIPAVTGVPRHLRAHETRVYCTLRVDGKPMGCQSAASDTLAAAVARAVVETLADRRVKSGVGPDDLERTRIELNILGGPVRLERLTLRELKQDIGLGAEGIFLTVGDAKAYFKSTVPITENYDHRKTLERLSVKAANSRDAWRFRESQLFLVRERHFVETDAAGGFLELRRGLIPRRREAISREMLSGAVREAAEWLARNQRESGLYAYLYLPHRAEWSRRQNLIRQAGTAWVMALAGSWLGEARYTDSARRCVDRLLSREEKTAGGACFIAAEGRGSLGSTALTLLALIGLDEEGADRSAMIRLGDAIVSSQILQEGEQFGKLRSSFTDSEYDVGQDYYPGEALLALGALYRLTGDESYRVCIENAFDFYPDYWRAERNTAFVSWQIQAAHQMFDLGGDRRYAEFAFELADWILARDAWTATNTSDPQFVGGIGSKPPRMNTGTYMEGIARAYAMARDLGDVERAARYRAHAVDAAGFLLQLQVKREELFYLPAEELPRAVGGFRMSLADHTLRIDSAQHVTAALMGMADLIDGTSWAR